MFKSKRAQRMARHQKRSATGRLNLISLMDIFTILVFFLLVNSSDVQEVPSSKIVQMPESVAEQKPRETVVVLVTTESILVQGDVVGSTSAALQGDEQVLQALKDALLARAQLLLTDTAEDPESAQREVTIMGDKSIPFSLLKKVMATCTEADYTRVSLAVVQKGADDSSAS